MAVFIHQSGPMKVSAMLILVYMAPRAQSCQGKYTGDWKTKNCGVILEDDLESYMPMGGGAKVFADFASFISKNGGGGKSLLAEILYIFASL